MYELNPIYDPNDNTIVYVSIMISIFFVILLNLLFPRHEGDGCFHGSNTILMSDNTVKACENIRKGDVFKMKNGKNARVVCVVKILKTQTNTIKLIKFPCGLIVTEYHPICVKTLWNFPINIKNHYPYEYDFDAVYSFLVEMEDGSEVDCGFIVQNIECAPLGHSIKEPNVEHDFFGNKNAVIENLKKMNAEQFDNGLVIATNLKRSMINGTVNGFIYKNS